MPADRLKAFLHQNDVNYATLWHAEAFTAYQVASAAHLPAREVVKTVMVKIDGELAMAVVPASRQVDVEVLRAALDADEVRLARETEFRGRFPDCETGAMPPFGNLYGMSVYVDQSLTQDTVIAFEAGTHCETIRIAYDDFARLVRPVVLTFSTVSSKHYSQAAVSPPQTREHAPPR
jgi:Ala-tRNA(Pro) deacylase